jgi:hypothetical protein
MSQSANGAPAFTVSLSATVLSSVRLPTADLFVAAIENMFSILIRAVATAMDIRAKWESGDSNSVELFV